MKKISISKPPPKKNELLTNDNGKKTPQYIAAIAASFSAFSTGTVLAWTTQISPKLLNGDYGFPIDQDQLGWIGSLTALGAAVFSLFVGPICDSLGRKLTKLLMVIPLAVGWALITWATNVAMLYVGRLLTGMIGGAFLVTGPLYCNEICQNEIRGSLGSFTQLMISFGLLFDAVASKYLSIYAFTLCCFAFPFLFAVIFVFMPETPMYFLKKNKEDEARKALRKLRGNNYDVEDEIAEMKTSLQKDKKGNLFQLLKDSLTRRATRMAFAITLGLMMFRSFSGVDVITTFTSYIFQSADDSFDPEIGPIIFLSIQAGFGVVQSLIVDKIGRKMLLLFSQITVTISLTVLGICFLLKNKELVDVDGLDVVNYLSLAALSTFSIGFSVGVAPIPLMLNAEMNPPETKSLVTSFNTFLGWLLAFALTKTFLLIEDSIGPESAFFIYGGVSFVGVAFTFFLLPETKGKSSDEIQTMLGKR